MDSVHGLGTGLDSHAWPWQWQEKEKQETVYHEECINTPICTAIALQSIHLFQSLLQKHCILFSPTHPCLYIYSYVFTPGLYRIDMRVFLRCGNAPEYTFRGHCSANHYYLPPSALHAIRMVPMWRMKHQLQICHDDHLQTALVNVRSRCIELNEGLYRVILVETDEFWSRY